MSNKSLSNAGAALFVAGAASIITSLALKHISMACMIGLAGAGMGGVALGSFSILYSDFCQRLQEAEEHKQTPHTPNSIPLKEM